MCCVENLSHKILILKKSMPQIVKPCGENDDGIVWEFP